MATSTRRPWAAAAAARSRASASWAARRARPGRGTPASVWTGPTNGDGYADVIVGTEDDFAGAFVVLGGAALPASQSLQQGYRGFRVYSATRLDQPCCQTGEPVAGAGDVNRDGLADVVVGSPTDLITVDGQRRIYAGEAFVVYGRSTPADTAVQTLTAATGRRIYGAAQRGVHRRPVVGGGGDLNGDGTPTSSSAPRGSSATFRCSAGCTSVFGP